MQAASRQPSASGWGRRVAAAVVIGALAVGAGACGSSGSDQKSASKTLRLGFERDILTFDPDNSFETAGLGAIRAVYQGLVQYAPGSTKVVGLLATDWKTSPDGKTITFTLRDGVNRGRSRGGGGRRWSSHPWQRRWRSRSRGPDA